MQRSKRILLAQFAGAFLSVQLWAGDISADIFYTQYGYGGTTATVGKVHAQYSFSTNSLVLSGNTTLYPGGAGFGAAGLAVAIA